MTAQKKTARAKKTSVVQGPTTIRHAVVLSAGPGTKMMELTRSGTGRKGISAQVDGHAVVWLTTDRSVLIPVTVGTHLVTFSVTGVAGRRWSLWVSKPGGATGGANGVVPDDGVFQVTIP